MSRKLICSVMALAWSLATLADHHGNHKHHHKPSLGTHEHGHLKLSLVTSGQELVAEFEAPAHLVVGFEHRPKNDKQKEKLAKAESEWAQKVVELLPPSSGCQVKKSQWKFEVEEVDGKDSHAEVHASATFGCDKALAGRTLALTPGKLFPEAKEIQLELLRENGSALSKEFKKGEMQVEL